MALKYVGGGYIIGVPARDLTDDEEKQHGKVIREQEKLTGVRLYDAVATPGASGGKQPDKPGKEG